MRESGILMPLFSLPSPYPIGSLGAPAYKFIDFLKSAGQSCWQLLPIGHTGFGDSPYQTLSSFAGNPYFIDLELLFEKGLLTREELRAERAVKTEKIDYGSLYKLRFATLRKAFSRFKADSTFHEFCRKNTDWLDDYSLFCTLKAMHSGCELSKWAKSYRDKNITELSGVLHAKAPDISFYKFLQFQFFEQFLALKEYANQNGIRLIGDIPIYVPLDSADVYFHPECFLLDADFLPGAVAGCPPDGFSPNGQLWGNPLYDWDYMEKTGYSWWKKRLKFCLSLFDVLRIDHFRGFESYFSIPFGKTPAAGEWKKGPSYKFFSEIKRDLGENLPIIAEDLGFLTEDVRRLLDFTGYSGMKVLQFAFDSREESDYLPHNFQRKCVVYTGTHDNDTLLGWQDSLPDADRLKAQEYLGVPSGGCLAAAMLNAAMASVGELCILTMPDILGLGQEGRINTPSTVGDNWRWRMKNDSLYPALSKALRRKTKLFGRLGNQK